MSTPDAASTAAAWRERRPVALAMFALVVLVAFESFAVTTVMPQVADLLDGRTLYAFAFAGPFATGVVGMVVAGAWSDRRGPAAPFAAGVALFVAGLVVAGAAATMPVLVAGRLGQGLGGGVINVTLLVSVARAYPPALHPRVFAWFSTAWVLPSIAGPAVAGLIADLAGWRWVFLGVAVLVVPAAVPLLTAVRRLGVDPAGPPAGAPAAPRPDPAPERAGRRVAWAVVVASAVLGLNLAAALPAPWSSVVAVAAAVTAVAAARPLLPPGTLRLRTGLPAVVATRLLLPGAFFGAQVYVPYLLVDRDGWGTTASGLGLSTAALAWSGASIVQGRLGTRLSSRSSVRLGCVLVLAGIVGTAGAAAQGLAPWAVVAAWTVTGAGMGLASSRLNVLLLGWSAPEDQGRNSAANSIADSLGAALALALTGVVFVAAGGDRVYAGPAPFVAAFVLTGALALGASLVAPRVGVPPTERSGAAPGSDAPGPDGVLSDEVPSDEVPSAGTARASAPTT